MLAPGVRRPSHQNIEASEQTDVLFAYFGVVLVFSFCFGVQCSSSSKLAGQVAFLTFKVSGDRLIDRQPKCFFEPRRQ